MPSVGGANPAGDGGMAGGAGKGGEELITLRLRQTPTSLEQASAAPATYAVPKWLAAQTAPVT